jgi:hypothetical protein
VKAAALNPNKLIIQQGASAGGVSKQLTGGSAVQVDDTTVELTLTNDDLNDLKADLDIATSTSDTALRLEQGAASDTSGNAIVVLAGSAVVASAVSPDGVLPS